VLILTALCQLLLHQEAIRCCFACVELTEYTSNTLIIILSLLRSGTRSILRLYAHIFPLAAVLTRRAVYARHWLCSIEAETCH
jgi:hypothetical protein